MKKMGLILIIAILLLTGCNSKKDDKNEPETITQYFDSKNINYLKVNCDILENSKIVHLNSNTFVLENGDVYEYTMSNKIYKNGQQCKLKEIDNNDVNDEKYIFLKNNNSIVDIVSNFKYDFYDFNYLILKNDGNVYKAKIIGKSNVNSLDDAEITKKELLYSKEDYGFIKKIFLTSESYPVLVTDKTLYNFKTIETEECKKYLDVECETKLVENEFYNKYKDEIKFIDSYTLLKGNKILKTESFLDYAKPYLK